MKYLILCVFVFSVLISCGPTSPEEGKPPERVRMVLRSANSDTAAVERGTDAYASSTNDIQIEWYSHPGGKELSKFNIYRSEEPDGSRKYGKIAEIKILNNQNQDTVFIDTDLQIQKKYYYYVTVENENGLTSEPSDTVWYALMDKPQLLKPLSSAHINADSITFEWNYPSLEPNFYILRAEKYWDESYHPLMSARIVQSNYEGSMEFVLSEDWIKNASSSDNYRWRVDAVGGDPLHEGAESEWRLFTIGN